ncbi:hypothetical protein BCR37DRAFT_349324 [Protomyces lactucae-debilis]|uniref:Nucleosome assembly protein n=1 Tax=Protomyces lactucae-debilis TaxID=2754530 RepID=A0A1Y2F817_PROLT|nr:uncharacterized protein BCR37DRAFT_349324 [Protomyces lactucae-debilis]ORY80042.1 hypothetical protein BCR37DRAFT_349324 [Protomyces lactucae-debilis]
MSDAQNIQNKRLSDLAPTPMNTPATPANQMLTGAKAPGVPKIDEEKEERDAIASALQGNPQLMNMIQGRLGDLVGKSSGYIESLPTVVRTRIHGLKGVQAEHAKLESQFQDDLLALEKKYLEKYAPLYARRAEIVAGTKEPTEQEIEVGLQDVDPDEEEAREQADANEETNIQGVPEFWLTAMKNVLSLQEMINARDEEALKSLTDIRMSYLDKPGFKLTFQFAENEFFSNSTLTKTYYYQEEAGYGGDFVYDHADGDEIKWHEGKNLTVRYETKKQRNKNTKQTRIVKKTVPVESFFNFFSPPAVPDDEDDNDVASDIDERLELDYQIGEDIKEKLIPRAVDWFTGEALAYEELDDEDLEEDYQDYDDEDESGDSEEEDSETEADGKPKQDPQECRQQ